MPPHHDTPTLSGSLPNIYNQALTFDHLRQLPTFTALPPVDAICIAGSSSYRYVRQDDDLWDRLHAGRLTSGYLSAALGLFEPAAAKRLKLGRSKISHGPLLSAYRHLSQQPYHPSVNENITEESAAVHNARITLAFDNSNGKINNAAGSTSDGGGGGTQDIIKTDSPAIESVNNSIAGASINPKKKIHRRRRKKKINTEQGGRTTPQTAAAAEAAGVGLKSLPSTISEEFKLKKARALSSQGLDAVRCAWGTAQESKTLHVLGTGIFPSSEIIEAGLFIMEESVLPKNWNFLPGELPPIGSSPDALAQHHHPVGGIHRSQGGKMEKEKEKVLSISEQAALLSKLTLEEEMDKFLCPTCAEERKLERKLTTKSESLLQVVEVKNTCPFDYSQTHTRGRKKGRKFVVCDRGPRAKIDVLWIPQLQLHMLCTQTSSALLVSRSATKGIRVFRVAADVEFQRLMLCVLRKLYTEHVIPQKVPEKDVYERMPEHSELLNRIRSAVNAAEVIKEISGEGSMATLQALASKTDNVHTTPGHLFKIDTRFFLD